jgi:NAD+ kinase
MIEMGRGPGALEVYEAVVEWADDALINDPNIIMIVGGDGAFLESVYLNGLDKTYVPINAGHLGFLLNDVWTPQDEHEDGHIYPTEGERIRDRNWIVREFPVIEVEFKDGTKECAINDVFMERASGQTARISVGVDGAQLVTKMVCDGVIVSTALGSTGYNLSAGGPIVHPLNRNIIITPSNAHRSGFKPIVLPGSASVRLYARDIEYRPVRTVVDGRGYENRDALGLRFGSDRLKVGYFEGHDFTRRLVNKILKQGEP